MSPTIKERIPAPLKAPIKKVVKSAIATGHGVRSRRELSHLLREYEERWGPGFVSDIAPADEMHQFMIDFWDWTHHVSPMRAPSDARYSYFRSGEVMLRDLEKILRDQGIDLGEVDSFLEFASGYGRFTRFLVRRVPPERVTVSDIIAPAVEFARKTFGVSGFPSTASAGDLEHDDRYQVIFVASLFSHLAIEHWTDWLRRLYDLLEPGGHLLFSTHGDHARDVIYGDHFKDQLDQKAPGFAYLLTNETDGRLAEDYYGSAFVTEDYVRAQVQEHGLGEIVRMYPTLLWGSQDVYVIHKPTG